MDLKKYFNMIYRYDDGLLINKKLGTIYCNEDRDGYIRVRTLGKEFTAHRIIWIMFNGDIPAEMLVDHIDRDVYNNRIENLRLASRRENNANNSTGKGSIYGPGITLNSSGKFRVRITSNGSTMSLGTFSTIEEATSVYRTKHKELFGQFSPY